MSLGIFQFEYRREKWQFSVLEYVCTRWYYARIAGRRGDIAGFRGRTLAIFCEILGSFLTEIGRVITGQSLRRSVDMIEELTAFQRDLLRIIEGSDKPHGLAIKDDLEAYYGKEIHHGRLYPNLDELVELNLVRKGELDKRTNFYEITKQGEKAVRDRNAWNQSVASDSDADADMESDSDVEAATAD